MAKINKDLFGEAAVYLQDAIEDEGEALKKYQEFLNVITRQSQYDYIFKKYDREKDQEVDSPTCKADKKMFELMIKEIKIYMAEEMKHLKGLMTLYEYITGIKPEV